MIARGWAASRIAGYGPRGRQPDPRRIAVVVLEPAALDAFNVAVSAAWRECPGAGYGDAVVGGELAAAILPAIADHGRGPGADAVWIADTDGRVRATSAYPLAGHVKVSG